MTLTIVKELGTFVHVVLAVVLQTHLKLSYKQCHLCCQIVENSVEVKKGCHSEVDSYSAFWDNNKLSQTELVRILAEHKVTDVFVCGVAYDVCVGK